MTLAAVTRARVGVQPGRTPPSWPRAPDRAAAPVERCNAVPLWSDIRWAGFCPLRQGRSGGAGVADPMQRWPPTPLAPERMAAMRADTGRTSGRKTADQSPTLTRRISPNHATWCPVVPSRAQRRSSRQAPRRFDVASTGAMLRRGRHLNRRQPVQWIVGGDPVNAGGPNA